MISTNTQLPFHCNDSAEVFEGSGIANLDARPGTKPRLTFFEGFDAGFTWGAAIAVLVIIILSIL
jgi:hypothetical protein